MAAVLGAPWRVCDARPPPLGQWAPAPRGAAPHRPGAAAAAVAPRGEEAGPRPAAAAPAAAAPAAAAPSPSSAAPASPPNGKARKQPHLVVTCFKWPAQLGAARVSVAGSWDGWAAPLPLSKTPSGDFVRSVALPPGPVTFKFLVDGAWRASPCEPRASEPRRRGGGGGGGGASGPGASPSAGAAAAVVNNHRLVAATAEVTWPSSQLGGAEVCVAGDWSCWGELVPLRRPPGDAAADHAASLCLPPGTHFLEFLVDGAWALSPRLDAARADDGRLANRLDVPPPPALRLVYATGWPAPALRARPLTADGAPAGPWAAAPLVETPSRAAPGGGAWRVGALPWDAAAAPGGYEFTVAESVAAAEALNAAAAAAEAEAAAAAAAAPAPPSKAPPSPPSPSSSSAYAEDRPYGGGAYRARHPGGLRLRGGRLSPFPALGRPRTMLVADLDGTMVGDGPDADAATAEFGRYWEDVAAPAGSVLVYNTGRSLGSFVGLLADKGGALPLPDALVTAVGTKIWLPAGGGGVPRGAAPADAWEEDAAWAAALDAGWDLPAARAAAQAVVDAEAGAGAAHWLDRGDEHPHRVALSVRADRVEPALARLGDALAAAGVRARLITSGLGEWRYVDAVAAGAGKLAALEYLRSLYGVAPARCMAAGDSGNDALMLGGRSPALVVGNAQDDLLEWALAQPQGPRLVVADAPWARGVLEGLMRHGLY